MDSLIFYNILFVKLRKTHVFVSVNFVFFEWDNEIFYPGFFFSKLSRGQNICSMDYGITAFIRPCNRLIKYLKWENSNALCNV